MTLVKSLLATGACKTSIAKASLGEPIMKHRNTGWLIDSSALASWILAATHLTVRQTVRICYVIVKTY